MPKQGAADWAARILAEAYGYGSGWTPSLEYYSTDSGQYDDPDDDPAEGTSALWCSIRGRVTEQAGAKSKHDIKQFRAWRKHSAFVVLPSCKPKHRALAALAYANLSTFHEALLLVYSGQHEKWIVADRYMGALGFSREAAADGMNRIMWARPDVSLENRAKMLHVRKSVYSKKVRDAEYVLLCHLGNAAMAFLHAYHAER